MKEICNSIRCKPNNIRYIENIHPIFRNWYKSPLTMLEYKRLAEAVCGWLPSSRSNEELIPTMKQLGISFSSNFDDNAVETLGSEFYHAWLTRYPH